MMRSYRLYLLISLFVIIMVVGLQYGRYKQLQAKTTLELQQQELLLNNEHTEIGLLKEWLPVYVVGITKFNVSLPIIFDGFQPGEPTPTPTPCHPYLDPNTSCPPYPKPMPTMMTLTPYPPNPTATEPPYIGVPEATQTPYPYDGN